MAYRDLKTLTARGQIQLKFAKRAAKLVNVFQCLILSADPARRDMLERAATEGGWKSLACEDATAALAAVQRSAMQLAVIDLEPGKDELFRPVVQQLTARTGLLLIVCGNEGNLEEEVWVRQLGAWLYLPGVVDGGNFSVLCGEARHIAEKVWKAGHPDRLTGSPTARSH